MAEPQRMRVGLVIGQLSYGGAEGQLCRLAVRLCRTHDVVVYCLSNVIEPYAEQLRAAGVPLRVFPAIGRFDVTRVVRLARALREDRIVVVHAFLFIASAYAFLATRFVGGTRLVTSARNCKLEPNPVRRWLMIRSFRASRAIICNSREMAAFATDHYGAPEGLIHIVYNGVDAQRFRTERQPHEGLRIGTVGRIERQKNLDLFLDAAAGVAERIENARFFVVGQGSERARLEARSLALGLGGKLEFVGLTDDVPGFLAQLDQFWLTSDHEGTPNVVLEAMAAGVPVIATRVGGTAEILVDGESGILVEKGEIGAFVEAGIRLASERSLSARMSTRARAEIESRYSIEAMVEATAQVYAEVST
jgi:glycosyltransferase involved in cell wall biosynthesis